jgi:hypothetical protein
MILPFKISEVNFLVIYQHNIIYIYTNLVYNIPVVKKGGVAQWLEQGTHNSLAVGSNPTAPTFKINMLNILSFNKYLRYETT